MTNAAFDTGRALYEQLAPDLFTIQADIARIALDAIGVADLKIQIGTSERLSPLDSPQQLIQLRQTRENGFAVFQWQADTAARALVCYHDEHSTNELGQRVSLIDRLVVHDGGLKRLRDTRRTENGLLVSSEPAFSRASWKTSGAIAAQAVLSMQQAR